MSELRFRKPSCSEKIEWKEADRKVRLFRHLAVNPNEAKLAANLVFSRRHSKQHWGLGLTLAAPLVLPGCPKDENPPCAGPTMSFMVLIVAAKGPLPQDTVFGVKHGANTKEEQFSVDEEFPESDVVFCCHSTRDKECVETPDGGPEADAGTPPVEALLCELWTDGAARVTLAASGYPTIETTLDARFSEGCIEPRDVVLKLERPDGGP